MKWFRDGILGAALLAFLSTPGFGQDQSQPAAFTLGPEGQVQEAYFQNWLPPDGPPKGVLVLVTGFIGQANKYNDKDLLEIEPWKQYALAHGLGFSLLSFAADGKKLDAGGGYCDAKLGAAQLFRNGLAKTFPSDAPVFVYGRNQGAVRFILSLLDNFPDAVASWCCYGGLKWDPLKNSAANIPPGIVAVTSDSIAIDDAKNLFFQGNDAGNKWTWVDFKPTDEDSFKAFVMEYFLAMTQNPQDQWRLIDTKEDRQKVNGTVDTHDLTWLPNSAVADLWSGLQTTKEARPTVIEKDVDLSQQGLPPIQFYLRLPPGATDTSGADGVLAYCTWSTNRQSLIQALSFDLNRTDPKQIPLAVQMLRFAAKHNLAVLTWSTPGAWKSNKNVDELTEDEQADIDKEFQAFADAWEKTIDEFCDEYKLPRTDYLLYGMSRGAQWAHRLALRKPDRFLAINAHVPGSFDEPIPEAKRCLWLVTSGEVDIGYQRAKWFYGEARKLGYPIIFKAGEGLGHDDRQDIDDVRDAFFEYALQVKKLRDADPNYDPAIFMSSDKANAVGNLLTQEVVPPEKASQIPEAYRVYLPNADVANAWKEPPPPPNP